MVLSWNRAFGGAGPHKANGEGDFLLPLHMVVVAQVGRAFRCGRNGWGFDSPRRPREPNGKGVGKTGVLPWRSSRTAGFVRVPNKSEGRREIPLDDPNSK